MISLLDRETQHAIFSANESMTEQIHRDSINSAAQSDLNDMRREEQYNYIIII